MLCGLVHVCAQEHLHATQPSLTVMIFLERGRFGPIGSRALCPAALWHPGVERWWNRAHVKRGKSWSLAVPFGD